MQSEFGTGAVGFETPQHLLPEPASPLLQGGLDTTLLIQDEDMWTGSVPLPDHGDILDVMAPNDNSMAFDFSYDFGYAGDPFYDPYPSFNF